jgi:cellulose synthase/poly-beta-1,6-N-acetylglucosamine synthase-like glycosyltransferase
LTAAAAALGALTLVLLAWSYVGYPALLRLLARDAPPTMSNQTVALPSVEVLVAAHDEEASIGPRVANLLAQRYGGGVAVAIGCDGCGDATAERARAAGDGRVRVEEFDRRRGKAAVVNDLVRASRAEILVFTDANSEFEPDAVARLAARFDSPDVGAACGRLILSARAGDPTPETEFWDRETELKQAEGTLGICLGANGAIYAARRELVAPLSDGAVLDDFLIPARIARDGRKVVFAGDAIARETVPADVASETSRRFRIGVGAGEVLRREVWLFDFRRRPLLALAFLSRKAARWLAPVAALGALLCALASPALRPVAVAAAAATALLAISVRFRPRLAGWPGRLYYFGVINLALAAGVVAGLAGYRRPVWKRTER